MSADDAIWPGMTREQKIATIINHWDQQATASVLAIKISKTLGERVSRNSIIGFYHRVASSALRKRIANPLDHHPLLGKSNARLGSRKSHTKEPRPAVAVKPERRNSEWPSPSRLVFLSNPPPADAIEIVQESPPCEPFALSRQFTLMDLPANGCKWPTHFETEHLFCGHSRVAGKPYCTHHLQRSTSVVSKEDAV